MKHFTTDDGRILTPPKELKPLLKGSFPAFYNLLGHIRFFYVTDEMWDGVSSLIFITNSEQLATITLEDSAFNIEVENDKFLITDESSLDIVFEILNKTASSSQHRPADQLSVDLNEYPNGIRCDLCLLYKENNINNDFASNRKFPIMDRHCYYGVNEGWGETEFSTWTCNGKDGCFTKTYACLEIKGFKNCLECGKYRACADCGVGHNPGECNLGITAEEIANLIIPYCDVERLDYMKSKGCE